MKVGGSLAALWAIGGREMIDVMIVVYGTKESVDSVDSVDRGEEGAIEVIRGVDEFAERELAVGRREIAPRKDVC